MSVKDGVRPGTKATDKFSGWDYILSQGPGWETLRAKDREVMRYMSALDAFIASLTKARAAAHVAQLMMHGGHVDKGTMALSGLKPGMEPAQVVDHVLSLVPGELKALI